ncbi:hypothetical protein vBRpoSV10_6 [Ruegeria phage vB_RpoS-V10]|nr:hypothetical protein vBRpoSV10_6 [Ruegeria phage vB_RpoS-V10]
MEKVDVYFNLHRKIWSIRSRKSGLVTAHSRVVVFPYGAEMIVQAAGRARVLQEGKKYVHAYVRGESPLVYDAAAHWQAFGESLPAATRSTYNPMRAGHFTRRDNGARIDHAAAVVMVAREGAPPEVWAVQTNCA